MKKKYKIGEFAKNLGVTIGFLKHHEADGILTPHIASSGYRYYEYSQGMQALQCLRLQSLGFSSKEISGMLNNSVDMNYLDKLDMKKKEIQEDLIYYQEVLKYLDSTSFENRENSDESIQENWVIQVPTPFYYLENSSEGEFHPDSDDKIYDIVCNWNQYMPMTGLCSCIETGQELSESEVEIKKWGMGLQISQKSADILNIQKNEKVQLVSPGISLIYTFSGVRPLEPGRSHLSTMLRRPLEICSEHNLKIQGVIYSLNMFASTANQKNYVHEKIIIPLNF